MAVEAKEPVFAGEAKIDHEVSERLKEFGSRPAVSARFTEHSIRVDLSKPCLWKPKPVVWSAFLPYYKRSEDFAVPLQPPRLFVEDSNLHEFCSSPRPHAHTYHRYRIAANVEGESSKWQEFGRQDWSYLSIYVDGTEGKFHLLDECGNRVPGFTVVPKGHKKVEIGPSLWFSGRQLLYLAEVKAEHEQKFQWQDNPMVNPSPPPDTYGEQMSETKQLGIFQACPVGVPERSGSEQSGSERCGSERYGSVSTAKSPHFALGSPAYADTPRQDSLESVPTLRPATVAQPLPGVPKYLHIKKFQVVSEEGGLANEIWFIAHDVRRRARLGSYACEHRPASLFRWRRYPKLDKIDKVSQNGEEHGNGAEESPDDHPPNDHSPSKQAQRPTEVGATDEYGEYVVEAVLLSEVERALRPDLVSVFDIDPDEKVWALNDFIVHNDRIILFTQPPSPYHINPTRVVILHFAKERFPGEAPLKRGRRRRRDLPSNLPSIRETAPTHAAENMRETSVAKATDELTADKASTDKADKASTDKADKASTDEAPQDQSVVNAKHLGDWGSGCGSDVQCSGSESESESEDEGQGGQSSGTMSGRSSATTGSNELWGELFGSCLISPWTFYVAQNFKLRSDHVVRFRLPGSPSKPLLIVPAYANYTHCVILVDLTDGAVKALKLPFPGPSDDSDPNYWRDILNCLSVPPPAPIPDEEQVRDVETGALESLGTDIVKRLSFTINGRRMVFVRNPNAPDKYFAAERPAAGHKTVTEQEGGFGEIRLLAMRGRECLLLLEYVLLILAELSDDFMQLEPRGFYDLQKMFNLPTPSVSHIEYVSPSYPLQERLNSDHHFLDWQTVAEPTYTPKQYFLKTAKSPSPVFSNQKTSQMALPLTPQQAHQLAMQLDQKAKPAQETMTENAEGTKPENAEGTKPENAEGGRKPEDVEGTKSEDVKGTKSEKISIQLTDNKAALEAIAAAAAAAHEPPRQLRKLRVMCYLHGGPNSFTSKDLAGLSEEMDYFMRMLELDAIVFPNYHGSIAGAKEPISYDGNGKPILFYDDSWRPIGTQDVADCMEALLHFAYSHLQRLQGKQEEQAPEPVSRRPSITNEGLPTSSAASSTSELWYGAKLSTPSPAQSSLKKILSQKKRCSRSYGLDWLVKAVTPAMVEFLTYGSSHGGFIGAHLIGRFPKYFKVAMLGKGVFDLVGMAATSDIPDWVCSQALGVYPYERLSINTIHKRHHHTKQDHHHRHHRGVALEMVAPVSRKMVQVPGAFHYHSLALLSPIYYARGVEAAVLISAGDKDLRVPASQARAMYRALQQTFYSHTSELEAADEKLLYLAYPHCDHSGCSNEDIHLQSQFVAFASKHLQTPPQI